MPWTSNVKIPNQKSKASPAMAFFRGRTHMVHLGNSSNDIWHSTFDGTRWTTNVKIPGQKSKASPALATYGGRLHMVHLGNSSNNIWHSTFDGRQWSTNVKIPNQSSKRAPALASFGGRLHMVHLGSSSNNIWHSNFNGTRWTPNVKIPDQKSKASPALATFGGRLHMVHLGNTSNNIWYSIFNGTEWTPNIKIPNQSSKRAPALAIFGRRLHMVHLGSSTNNIWHSSSDGVLSVVRLGLKVLVTPTISVNTMLRDMRTVYASRGFLVQVVNNERLNLPALTTVDVGQCRMGSVTAEQRQLFRNRNNLQRNDVAVYFVRATNPAFNGCAAHPNGVPACVVASGATRWTMGHEVGHVLGLNHVNNNNRLMTGNGTSNITNPPPDLTLGEGRTMADSGFSIE